MRRLLLATAALLAAAAPASAAEPRLEARAILPADALLDARDGRCWAMPDNGFGSKANSRSFILRVYKVRSRWETKWSGDGRVDVLSAVTLRDPDLKVPR